MSNINREENHDNLTTLLRHVLHQWSKSSLHTARPGLIESYNLEARRANVRAALRTVFTGEEPGQDGEAMEGAVSVNVPVIFPSGGGHTLVFPLTTGDPVMLLFSERGLSEFKTTYELSTPDRTRFFSESDAVAIPGFGPLLLSPASATGAALQTNNGESFVEVSSAGVRIHTPGVVSIGGAAGSHLVNESFLTLFNLHTHATMGSPPTQQASAGNMTTKTRAE